MAAGSDGSRLSAEQFAIVLSHAIANTSSSSQADFALDEFGSGLSDEALREIDEKRQFAGSTVIAGSFSWIRSSLSEGGERATVMLVEKCQAGIFADSEGEPFVFWVQVVVSLERDGGEWQLTDYASAAASESERFSDSTWRLVMDSGKGWRRNANN